MVLIAQIAQGGPLAQGAALALLLAAGLAGLGYKRGSRFRAAAGLFALMGIVLGIAATQHPAWGAVAAVSDIQGGGLESGCAKLGDRLRQDHRLEERIEGAQKAVEACVDDAIARALAVKAPTDRAVALLEVARADASLTPTPAQFRRIHGEVDAIPQGLSSVRLRAFEVKGPLVIDPIRAHARDQLLRIMGCQAQASRRGQAASGAITVTLRVDAAGTIKSAAMSAGDLTLQACVASAFEGAELGTQQGSSRVTIETEWQPFQTG